MYILSCLRRDQRCVLRINADYVLDLLFHALRICAGQINLIDDRHHIQIMIQRQIDICQCLRLHPLCRIHHQNGSVAGCKASGNLIIEIHVSWGIDQIEHILLTVVRLVDGADRLRFDRDTPLPLQIHVVENLGLHLAACQKPRHLNNAVSQRGLAMVDMCNNAKISDFTLIYYCQFDSSIFMLNLCRMFYYKQFNSKMIRHKAGLHPLLKICAFLHNLSQIICLKTFCQIHIFSRNKRMQAGF